MRLVTGSDGTVWVRWGWFIVTVRSAARQKNGGSRSSIVLQKDGHSTWSIPRQRWAYHPQAAGERLLCPSQPSKTLIVYSDITHFDNCSVFKMTLITNKTGKIGDPPLARCHRLFRDTQALKFNCWPEFGGSHTGMHKYHHSAHTHQHIRHPQHTPALHSAGGRVLGKPACAVWTDLWGPLHQPHITQPTQLDDEAVTSVDAAGCVMGIYCGGPRKSPASYNRTGSGVDEKKRNSVFDLPKLMKVLTSSSPIMLLTYRSGQHKCRQYLGRVSFIHSS